MCTIELNGFQRRKVEMEVGEKREEGLGHTLIIIFMESCDGKLLFLRDSGACTS